MQAIHYNQGLKSASTPASPSSQVGVPQQFTTIQQQHIEQMIEQAKQNKTYSNLQKKLIKRHVNNQ